MPALRYVERPTGTARVGAGAIEYRLERRGEATIVVFHGGHVRAGLPIGEEVFAELGCSILAPSRPGYGRTPLGTGTSPAGFADATYELCRQLGIDTVAAAVGISGGGPTALTMAARHPDLSRRLILESAVGFLPWPDRGTRIGARVLFNSFTERITWAVVRGLLRLGPTAGLRFMMRSLSTEPPTRVVAALFFFSSRRRHTRFSRDWSSDVCSSDLGRPQKGKRVFKICKTNRF